MPLDVVYEIIWRMKKNCLLLICLTGQLFLGCSEKSTADSPQSAAEKPYDKLSGDAVLMKVGSRTLDKKSLQASADLRLGLAKIKNRLIDEKTSQNYIRKTLPILQKQFYPKALYLNEVDKLNIVPSDTDVKDAQMTIMLGYGPSGMEKFELFKTALSTNQYDLLVKQVAEDASILAYWRSRAPEAFVVTPEEFQQISNRVSYLQKKSAELMVSQRALAKEVYAKLQSGLEFSDLAHQYSGTTEEDEEGYLWGAFLPKDIPYPEMIEQVRKLSVGEFTEPVELDDAIHIVKRYENTGVIAGGQIATSPDEYVLGRIVINLPMSYEIASEAEIRRSMRKKKLEPLQRQWLDELTSRESVEYPSGTNLWKAAQHHRKGIK